MKYKHDWRNQYTLKLRKRLGKPAFCGYWEIPNSHLFGSDSNSECFNDESYVPCEMTTFTIWHYVNFLDSVKSLEDLREGLFSLSPFAHDAFEVSEGMNDSDFVDFKLALVTERMAQKGECCSVMPEKYYPILLPARFLNAIMISDKAVTSLGVALIRIMEVELGIE